MLAERSEVDEVAEHDLAGIPDRLGELRIVVGLGLREDDIESDRGGTEVRELGDEVRRRERGQGQRPSSVRLFSSMPMIATSLPTASGPRNCWRASMPRSSSMWSGCGSR